MKKGEKSVEESRKNADVSGRIDNCLVSVHACLSNEDYCSLIDKKLFLPECWCRNPERCERAGRHLPGRHCNKPELAMKLIRKVELINIVINHILIRYLMKTKNLYIFLLIFAVCPNCQHNSTSEKHQKNRTVIVNVQDKVKEIQIEDILIGSIARLFILDDFLFIADYKSEQMLIHLFNKNNYAYVTSALQRGQGPYEIANMGHIGLNDKEVEFYVSDHGKLKIFAYPLDSILHNSLYVPNVISEINNGQFPGNYKFINDTLAFARMIEPTGNSGYNEFVARWNMKSGEIKKFNYSHPKIMKKRISFAVSIENETVVECYSNYNLMTILDLNGNLKCNVYGSNWDSLESEKIHNFGKVAFCKDKIVVSFSGENRMTNEYFPTQIMIFKTDGDYIKTLKVGYRIADFCYDEQNNRLIMNFEDMIQFGYLDLDGLLD